LIGGVEFVPRRCRGAAGGDGGFGRRRKAWFVAVSNKKRGWADARGRGKETETRMRTRGLRGSPEFDLEPLQYGGLRRLIAAAWRGSVSGERENRERGVRALRGRF
jgi:hypothetical protein